MGSEEQVPGAEGEQKAKKRVVKSCFKKGDPRINRRGRAPMEVPEDWGSEEEGEKRSRLLRDMRLVYVQGPTRDRTRGQRTLRKMLQESPREFIQQLAKLEEAEAKRKGEEEAQGELDEGTARVKELMEEEWADAERFWRTHEGRGKPEVPGEAAGEGGEQSAVEGGAEGEVRG